MTFIFGADAFRDNERERKYLAEAIERIEAGDDVEDLTTGELERLAQAATAEGSNDEAVAFGKRAQNHLDNEAEAQGVRQAELDFKHYWEGRPATEDRERDQLRDAGRFR